MPSNPIELEFQVNLVDYPDVKLVETFKLTLLCFIADRGFRDPFATQGLPTQFNIRESSPFDATFYIDID